MKKEFKYAFEITRKVIFMVSYYTLGNNPSPHFCTSAVEFNQPKTDYCRCGQCQDDVLPAGSAARSFYEKWDHLHLNDLDKTEYEQVIQDIEILKESYNHIECVGETIDEGRRISSCEIKELSMLPLKKKKKEKSDQKISA